MSDEVKMIAALIEQAKHGHAGLIVISVATAEALIRQLQTQDGGAVETPGPVATKKKKRP